jgi:hypothetical protein
MGRVFGIVVQTQRLYETRPYVGILPCFHDENNATVSVVVWPFFCFFVNALVLGARLHLFIVHEDSALTIYKMIIICSWLNPSAQWLSRI